MQIVLAPCSPFSVTGELMRQSAALAREYGVHLHTHLAETQDEEAFCLREIWLPPGGLYGVAGLGGPGCVVRPFGARQPGRRSSCIAQHRLRRGALPHFEHAAGLRHRAADGDPARPASRSGWAWMARPATTARTCWREARQAMLLARLQAGSRGLAFRSGCPAADDRPPGAGTRHARRRRRAGPRRHRLSGSRQMRRFLRYST